MQTWIKFSKSFNAKDGYTLCTFLGPLPADPTPLQRPVQQQHPVVRPSNPWEAGEGMGPQSGGKSGGTNKIRPKVDCKIRPIRILQYFTKFPATTIVYQRYVIKFWARGGASWIVCCF